MNVSTIPTMEYILEEIEMKADPNLDLDLDCGRRAYDTLINSDWKLDPHVECRVSLERLENFPATQKFQRDLVQPPIHRSSETSADIYLKFKLLVDELSTIFTKCEEKCGVCVEYILKLCQHIAETHEGRDQESDSTSSDFSCNICDKIFSTSYELIHHRESHSNSESLETIPVTISDSFNTLFANIPIIINLTSETITFTNDTPSHTIGQAKDKSHVDVSQNHSIDCYCDICGEILPRSSELTRHRESHSNSESLETIPVKTSDLVHYIPPALDMPLANTPIIINLTSQTETFTNNSPLQNINNVNENVDVRQKNSMSLSIDHVRQKSVISTNDTSPPKFEYASVISHSSSENNSTNKKLRNDSDVASTGQRVFHYSKVRKISLMKFTCEKCGKDFDTRSYFTNHVTSEHGEDKMNVKYMKPFKCETCGKFFRSNHHLSTHKLVHTGERNFKCCECEKSYTRLSGLKAHKLFHAGKKPFKCDMCEKSFRKATRLNEHKRVHTGERPFKCDACGKCFTTLSVLNKHKFFHTGEKQFKCDECEQCFPTLWDLKDHKNRKGEKPHRPKLTQCRTEETTTTPTPTPETQMPTLPIPLPPSEKTFKCDECGECFSRLSVLKTHKFFHTGEKPFKCDECGQCYSTVGDLNAHKNRTISHRPKFTQYRTEETQAPSPLLPTPIQILTPVTPTPTSSLQDFIDLIVINAL